MEIYSQIWAVVLIFAIQVLVVRLLPATKRNDAINEFWSSQQWAQPMRRLFASSRAHLDSLYGLKRTVAHGYAKVRQLQKATKVRCSLADLHSRN